MSETSDQRLILLRHAKSDWPQGIADLDRPLAARGIADATAAGPRLTQIAVPDLVLCSPARRTRQTWRLVALALDPPPAVSIESDLYDADADDVIGLLHRVAAGTGTVMLIGHEPTMSTLASRLAGPDSDPEALARLQHKYPTCALAVLRLRRDWPELAEAGADLEQFRVPRG